MRDDKISLEYLREIAKYDRAFEEVKIPRYIYNPLSHKWYEWLKKKDGVTEYLTDGKIALPYLQWENEDRVRFIEDQRYPTGYRD
jgi:hypothetical protein